MSKKNVAAAKRKYCKVLSIFKTHFPEGAIITDVCDKFRQLYPQRKRDCADIICGQKNKGNLKIIGQNNDGVSIYQLYTPTEEEKEMIQYNAKKKNLDNAQKAFDDFMEKRAKRVNKKSLKIVADEWDLDQVNHS